MFNFKKRCLEIWFLYMAVVTGHMVYFSAYAHSDWNISDKYLKSWNDVTIIPSLLFLVSQFCTRPEVKFHVFVCQNTGKENRYLIFFCHTYQYIVDILSSKIKESAMFTLKPMKLKAAMELDILCCGYSRQLVCSIFFATGMPTLVMWAASLFLPFCLIFSYFPRQKGNSPYFLVALLQFDMKISLRLCISRNLYFGNFHCKCLKTCPCTSL